MTNLRLQPTACKCIFPCTLASSLGQFYCISLSISAIGLLLSVVCHLFYHFSDLLLPICCHFLIWVVWLFSFFFLKLILVDYMLLILRGISNVLEGRNRVLILPVSLGPAAVLHDFCGVYEVKIHFWLRLSHCEIAKPHKKVDIA